MHYFLRFSCILAAAVAISSTMSFSSAEAKTYHKTCKEGKECKISVPFQIRTPEPETKIVVRPSAFDVTLSVGAFGYLTDVGGGTEHASGGFDGRIVANYSPWANNIFLRFFIGGGYGWTNHRVVGAPGTEKWDSLGVVTSQEGLGVEWRWTDWTLRVGGKHRTLWQMTGDGRANMFLAMIGFGLNLSKSWTLMAELEVGWDFFWMEDVIWNDPSRTVGDPPRVENRSLNAPIGGGVIELEYRF